jgi:ATP-binding cassette subfamily B protein/subfamily B ATP-binding cassette protein MsbA
LDTISENLLQDSLSKFQENRTVLVVAHRYSTLAMADEVLVLDKGGIVEVGTKKALLSEGGFFAKSSNLQLKFLEENND